MNIFWPWKNREGCLKAEEVTMLITYGVHDNSKAEWQSLEWSWYLQIPTMGQYSTTRSILTVVLEKIYPLGKRVQRNIFLARRSCPAGQDILFTLEPDWCVPTALYNFCATKCHRGVHLGAHQGYWTNIYHFNKSSKSGKVVIDEQWQVCMAICMVFLLYTL